MNTETQALSFTPSNKLELALKATQSRIEQLGITLNTISETEKTTLHTWAMISNVGASTRIENAVLTDAEIEWVDTTLSFGNDAGGFEAKRSDIIDKLSKDKERSIEEVVGCRELLGIIYLQAKEMYPLSETSICGLHKVLLNHYPSAAHYAGRYKTTTNQVVSMNHETGERRTVLDPTPPGPQTDVAMRDLVVWYNQSVKAHPWPLLVATEFVFRFLAIHPFQDGNGRLGRGLFLLALIQGTDSVLAGLVNHVSIDRQIERQRQIYYSTLQQVSGGRFRTDAKEYDYEALAWFFLKMLDAALGDIDILRSKYAALQKLSESATKILSCFKSSPERRLAPAELINDTGLVRRTVQNSLNSLLNTGFIQKLGAGAGTRYQLIF